MAIQKTWKHLSRELFKIFPVTCDVPACLPAYATGSVMASVTPDAQVGVGVGALTGAMGSLVVLPNYFSSIFTKF